MYLTRLIRKFERDLDGKAEQFLIRHSLLGFLAIFVGMPLLVLSCVCLCTMALAYPMGLLFGWM